MTTILTSDVQTYVRELILKEFGSANRENTISENQISINREHQKLPQQPAVLGQKVKE